MLTGHPVKNIGEKTFYVFGACNALTLPIVWALYPESNQRTLEEMDFLFAADSPWNWDAEKTYARLLEENPGMVQAARQGSVVDPETGRRSSRKFSLVPGDGAHSPSSEEAEKGASYGSEKL